MAITPVSIDSSMKLDIIGIFQHNVENHTRIIYSTIKYNSGFKHYEIVLTVNDEVEPLYTSIIANIDKLSVDLHELEIFDSSKDDKKIIISSITIWYPKDSTETKYIRLKKPIKKLTLVEQQIQDIRDEEAQKLYELELLTAIQKEEASKIRAKKQSEIKSIYYRLSSEYIKTNDALISDWLKSPKNHGTPSSLVDGIYTEDNTVVIDGFSYTVVNDDWIDVIDGFAWSDINNHDIKKWLSIASNKFDFIKTNTRTNASVYYDYFKYDDKYYDCFKYEVDNMLEDTITIEFSRKKVGAVSISGKIKYDTIQAITYFKHQGNPISGKYNINRTDYYNRHSNKDIFKDIAEQEWNNKQVELLALEEAKKLEEEKLATMELSTPPTILSISALRANNKKKESIKICTNARLANKLNKLKEG